MTYDLHATIGDLHVDSAYRGNNDKWYVMTRRKNRRIIRSNLPAENLSSLQQ